MTTSIKFADLVPLRDRADAAFASGDNEAYRQAQAAFDAAKRKWVESLPEGKLDLREALEQLRKLEGRGE